MNWQSDREQSYYAELFQSCDTEGTGRISWIQAAELFRSARLGQDVLLQVSGYEHFGGDTCMNALCQHSVFFHFSPDQSVSLVQDQHYLRAMRPANSLTSNRSFAP